MVREDLAGLLSVVPTADALLMAVVEQRLVVAELEVATRPADRIQGVHDNHLIADGDAQVAGTVGGQAGTDCATHICWRQGGRNESG
jgi:hypothetical protein